MIAITEEQARLAQTALSIVALELRATSAHMPGALAKSAEMEDLAAMLAGRLVPAPDFAPPDSEIGIP